MREIILLISKGNVYYEPPPQSTHIDSFCFVVMSLSEEVRMGDDCASSKAEDTDLRQGHGEI